MAQEKRDVVTMRVRMGDAELEVTGPPSYVEEKIAKFLADLGTKHVEKGHTGTSADKGSLTGPHSVIKDISIAQFLKRLTLSTDVDRTLAAGYYLEHYKGYEKFTAPEIKSIIRDAKTPPPQNPNETINKNIKKGFMMAAGDKDNLSGFVLTTDGEQAIEQGLAREE